MYRIGFYIQYHYQDAVNRVPDDHELSHETNSSVRRWPSIGPALAQTIVFSRVLPLSQNSI